MVVGMIISLLQAVTQVQEMTVVFVPKIPAVFIVMSYSEVGCSRKPSTLVPNALAPFKTFQTKFMSLTILVTAFYVLARMTGLF